MIPTILNNGNRIIIHNSMETQMECLFNALSYKLQKITNVKTETFKKKLDKWLIGIPDASKIDDYGASVSARTNCIVNQKQSTKTRGK